jgi:hypothetical protein
VPSEKQSAFLFKCKTNLLTHGAPLQKLKHAEEYNELLEPCLGSWFSADNRTGISADSLIQLLEKFSRNPTEVPLNLSIAYYPPDERVYFQQEHLEIENGPPKPKFIENFPMCIGPSGKRIVRAVDMVKYILSKLDTYKEIISLYDNFTYNHASSNSLSSTFKILKYKSGTEAPLYLCLDYYQFVTSKSLNVLVASNLPQCVDVVGNYCSFMDKYSPIRLNLETVWLFENSAEDKHSTNGESQQTEQFTDYSCPVFSESIKLRGIDQIN